MDEDGIIEQRSARARLESVVYPDSDDEPMAENMVQADAIRAAYLALKGHFLSCPNRPLLAGDMLMYYVEGDPTQSVAPDVMAVFGVGTRRRSSYKLWEERKAPDFILEVSSPSSREKDRTTKADLYASLGVREYFLFDPGDQEDAEDLEEPEDGPDGEVLCYRLVGHGLLGVRPEPFAGTGAAERDSGPACATRGDAAAVPGLGDRQGPAASRRAGRSPAARGRGTAAGRIEASRGDSCTA